MKDIFNVNPNLKIKGVKHIFIVFKDEIVSTNYSLKDITSRVKLALFDENIGLKPISEYVKFTFGEDKDIYLYYEYGINREVFKFNSKINEWDKAANILAVR